MTMNECDIKKALQEMRERDKRFWDRHQIPHEFQPTEMHPVLTSEANQAWLKSVEHEYKSGEESEGRVFLDTPIARKAFILGYNRARQDLIKKDV